MPRSRFSPFLGNRDDFVMGERVNWRFLSHVDPDMNADLCLRFLGAGNAQSLDLGNSSAVLERGGAPLLLIDCGPDTVRQFAHAYNGELPAAAFITHTHLDHIGGLESLFYLAWFREPRPAHIKLYVPVKLVEWLHKRVADYPNILAEGGVNFWDCFQLVPVSEQFWHAGLRFSVFPVRHHEYLSAYGIALEGRFVFTGDTRPIPEVLNRYACRGETVFHDCALKANPSHTGVGDLASSYQEEQLLRFVLYHYESRQAGDYMEQMGFRVARPGERFGLGTGPGGEPGREWRDQPERIRIEELGAGS